MADSAPGPTAGTEYVKLEWDYETLYAIQGNIQLLADRAAEGGGSGMWAEVGAAGAQEFTDILGSKGLAEEMATFFRRTTRRIDEGTEKLRHFGNVFRGIADGLFQMDSNLAHSALAETLTGQRDAWREQTEAHDAWSENRNAWDAYLERIGAADYFDAHPDDQIWQVCSAANPDAPAWCETWRADRASDDHQPPLQPGDEPPRPSAEPPNRVEYVKPDGNSVELTFTYDDDYNITKEVSVNHLPSGEEIIITTEWEGQPDIQTAPDGKPYNVQDYTTTTDMPDGSRVVENVVIDDTDGSGTMTSTETYTENGETRTRTTEYTRSGPFEKWKETGGDGDDTPESRREALREDGDRRGQFGNGWGSGSKA